MPNNKLLYSVIVILVLLLVAAGYYLAKFPNPVTGPTKFSDSAIIFTGSKSSSSTLSVYKYNSDGTTAEIKTPSFTDPLNATLSPDLKQLAFVAVYQDTAVIAVSDLSGNVRQVSKLDGAKTMPSWSPDGSKILYALGAQSGGISQVDLGNGTDKVIGIGGGAVQNPVWLPDGSGFLYVALDVDQTKGSVSSRLELYKNGTSQEIKLSGDKGALLTDMESPSVSPDGKKIALVRSSDNRVYTAGIDGKNFQLLTKSGGSLFACPSWSGDGKFILVSESTVDGKYYLSKIDAGNGAITRSSLSGFNKINCPRMVRY